MMNAPTLKSLARAKLAFAALAAAGAVFAGQQLTADVVVKVKLVTSSGTCGAVSSAPAVQVTCQQPGGALLPAPGAVPYQRVGLVQGAGLVGVAAPPLPVYTDGTKITSWRVVQLDNARYLELTIAW